MPFPFAIQREPAGSGQTPAAFKTNSGTAAGRVGVAVPLALAAVCSWSLAGCAGDVRQSAYFPESVTAGVTEDFDVHGRASATGISTSFKWRLKPAPVIALCPTNPNPTPTAAVGGNVP